MTKTFTTTSTTTPTFDMSAAVGKGEIFKFFFLTLNYFAASEEACFL